MARWDDILSLPVQSPPTMEFSSADLVWSSVEGWRETVDRVALIPFSRVDDFVRGESSNNECPSRFHVEARRRRPQGMLSKPRVDGYLEYILYWCSFGPDDHRKGGTSRPSRSFSTRKKKSSVGRPSTKRGCVCHFIVKRLIAESSVALIIYNQTKHVDKKGLPCHGPLDSKAAGTRAMFAPYISDELQLQVVSLLYAGVPVESIMQKHTKKVEKQGGARNRDDLLTHRYVRRLERSIRRSTFELDPDDSVSIKMWVESHQNHVFFYEDFADSLPFVLGIQTEWQLQQMINFGNRSLIASDSRFGTNKLKYPVHSLLVFDLDNNAIPIAWIITPRVVNNEMTDRWIRALYDRVHVKDQTWKLAGFIVDDPATDILTIREVFQCSVLICFWRVRHAWHKNLIKKCSEPETCAEMFGRLGNAIYSICKQNGDASLFEDFMEDFVDGADFVEYFYATWFPKMGIWTAALKSLFLASQETCAAMESYHHLLKLRLLNEKDTSVYQRADWLVNKLGTEVHSYYWLDNFTGKDDFARYRKDEWISGSTAWRRASEIPDANVILENRYAKVASQGDPEQVHIIWNPGSEFSLCGCKWSRAGNLCEHVIKVNRVYRSKGLAMPSISLLEYNCALVNMLHCPPHDSLILDHAVSLAVYVQIQLSTIFDPKQNLTNLASSERNMANGLVVSGNEISEDGDRDLVDESQSVNASLCSADNAFSARDQVADDIADEVGNGLCSTPLNLVINQQQTVGRFSFGNEISEGGDGNLMDGNQPIDENLSSLDNAFSAREQVPSLIADEADRDLGSSLPNFVSERLQTLDGFASGNEISEGACLDWMNKSQSVKEIFSSMDTVLAAREQITGDVTEGASLPNLEIEQREMVDVVASGNGILEGGDRELMNESKSVNGSLSSAENAFTISDQIHGDITGSAGSDHGSSLPNLVIDYRETVVQVASGDEITGGGHRDLMGGRQSVNENLPVISNALTATEQVPNAISDESHGVLDFSKSNLMIDQQQTVGVASGNNLSEGGGGDLMNENQSVNGSLPSAEAFANGDQVCGDITGKAGSDLGSLSPNLAIDSQHTIGRFVSGDEVLADSGDRNFQFVNENLSTKVTAGEQVPGDSVDESGCGFGSSPPNLVIDQQQLVGKSVFGSETSMVRDRDLVHESQSSVDNVGSHHLMNPVANTNGDCGDVPEISVSGAFNAEGGTGTNQMLGVTGTHDGCDDVLMEVDREDQMVGEFSTSSGTCGFSKEVNPEAIGVAATSYMVLEESSSNEQMEIDHEVCDFTKSGKEDGVAGDGAPAEMMIIEIAQYRNMDSSDVAEEAGNSMETNVLVIGNGDCENVVGKTGDGFCKDDAEAAGTSQGNNVTVMDMENSDKQREAGSICR